MDVIDTLIPGIKSGDEKQFKVALSKYRKSIGRYTVSGLTATPIAEYDRDNCHVVIRTKNGEPCFSIWEKKELGYIVHVIVHKNTAEYSFDQIPF